MIVENRNAKSTRTDGIFELYTDDNIAALNATLLERGIKADQIISVLAVPGRGMGQPVPPKFRVLYRAN